MTAAARREDTDAVSFTVSFTVAAGAADRAPRPVTEAERAELAELGEAPCGRCGWHPIVATPRPQAWPWLWDTHARDARKRGTL